jgi:dihydrofolate reductase
MSATVLYMSMSLDGFIAGPNETVDHGLGDGGMRLHQWFFTAGKMEPERLTGANRVIWDEMLATGAVVAGRGTFDPARGWGGDHHDGVPIYILSRHPAPEWAAQWPLVHYVDDLAFAMTEAKRRAGGRNVLVHGAGITQRALKAGLLDEIEVSLVPVVLGGGRPLFEHLGVAHHELEQIRALQGDGVTHLHYRVKR